VIAKPASLAALEACVQRALDAAAPPAPPETAAAPVVAEVVARHFGGDQALYDAFSAACHGQFTLDLRQGNSADTAGDLPALRRLAHSLKSVLQTLGHDDASRAAAALEALAAEGDRARAPAAWARLRDALAALAR
jgi:Hpt domain